MCVKEEKIPTKVSLMFFGILVEAASRLGQDKRETKLNLPVIQKYWKMSFFSPLVLP